MNGTLVSLKFGRGTEIPEPQPTMVASRINVITRLPSEPFALERCGVIDCVELSGGYQGGGLPNVWEASIVVPQAKVDKFQTIPSVLAPWRFTIR